MKKISKLLLSLILVLLTTSSVLPITSMAIAKDGIFTYSVSDDGTATLEGISNIVDGDIVIPSTLGGYPLTSIDDDVVSYNDNDEITSVTIPDSVTSIGDYAFDGCENLKSVILPDSLVSIGTAAFRDCEKLRSITIPDSVTVIKKEAFSGCVALSDITLPDALITIDDKVFNDTAYRSKDSNWENGVLYIGNHLISAENAEGSLIIKDGTKSIAGCAFSGSDVRYVTIPSSVTAIADYAFSSSDILRVIIPSSVTMIGNSAFRYCDWLSDIIIPESVTSIGKNAFSGCDRLDNITIPESVRYIGESAFSDSDLKKITILSPIETIESDVFNDCGSLVSVSIPASVKSIGESAFYWCFDLTDIYYAGSEDQWNKIDIGTENDKIYSADVHFNSEIKADVSFTDSDKAKLSGDYVVIEKDVTIGQLLNQTSGGAVLKDADGNTFVSDKTLATGLKLVFADKKEYTIVLAGDVDGNGKISASDARLALRAAANLEKLSETQKKAADKNGDGAVRAADARIILRISAGLTEEETTKPPETTTKPVETTKPSLTISAEQYKYLAGTDFRNVKNTYSNSTANGAYVVAFVNADGDQCILTYVSYKLLDNWSVTTLHNITKGTTITDPYDYYNKLANRSYGATKINYMSLASEVMSQEMIAIRGLSDMLASGTNSGNGVYVNAKTLNQK